MTSSQAIARAKNLCAARNHAAALQFLINAHRADPNSPELNAEIGLLLCLLQREMDAVERIHAAKSNRLNQTLVNYLHCRSICAKRMGIEDSEGAEAYALLRTLAEPDEVGIEITACLIVKNEEKHLSKCLESLRNAVDEIVVVDTGSTDATVDIAQSFGATIDTFEWCNDFSAARNHALKLATKHWILWIDADEILAYGSERMLREAAMRPHFGGFNIRIENIMSEVGEADVFVHAPVRLFRNLPSIQFSGRIHEQVLPSIDRAGFPVAHLGGVTIQHFGYRSSDMRDKDKINRTLEMLLTEIEAEPNCAFHWFNLANTLVVDRQFAAALPAAEKCVSKLDEDASYGPLAYHLLCTSLLELKAPDRVLEACAQADASGFGSILAEFDRAQAYFAMERLDEALRSSDTCLRLEWPDDLVGDYGIKTHKTHVLRAQIFCAKREFHDAMREIERALAHDPAFSVALATKGVVLAGLGETESALEHLEFGFEDRNLGITSRVCAAKIFLQREDPAKSIELLTPLWNDGVRTSEVFATYVSAVELLGDSRKVLEIYEAFAAENEPSNSTLINWGRALMKNGEIQRAINCFSEASKRDPQDANARFNCGDALYAAGSYSDAAHIYESALRLEPRRATGWFALGNCFFQLGMLDGAEISYKEAINIDSSFEDAKSNLAMIYEARTAA